MKRKKPYIVLIVCIILMMIISFGNTIICIITQNLIGMRGWMCSGILSVAILDNTLTTMHNDRSK